jgi:lysophospholipase L1-like esterase
VSDYELRDGKRSLRLCAARRTRSWRLNNWIKEFAKTHRYVYLDYFSAMVDDKGFFKHELSYDGLHPNAAGYALMAPLAEAAIAASLKSGNNSPCR